MPLESVDFQFSPILGNFSPTFFQIFFVLFLWYSNYTCVRPLDTASQVTGVLFIFLSASFSNSVWKVSTSLSLSSQKFSFAKSNMMLTSFHELFIQILYFSSLDKILEFHLFLLYIFHFSVHYVHAFKKNPEAYL